MDKKPWFWQEERRCNRKSCTRCPHGPYWFGEVGGKRVYYGKRDPRPVANEDVDFPPDSEDIGTAALVLGIGLWQSREAAETIYAHALATCADDSPHSVRVRARLIHAWTVLARYQGWQTRRQAKGETK